MKIHSTIVLILWVVSISAPLMSLHADECDMACCVMTENICPMEEHGEKCPGMQAGTPIPPIPVAPVNTVKADQGIIHSTTSRTIPLEQILSFTAVYADTVPYLLPLQNPPLLI